MVSKVDILFESYFTAAESLKDGPQGGRLRNLFVLTSRCRRCSLCCGRSQSVVLARLPFKRQFSFLLFYWDKFFRPIKLHGRRWRRRRLDDCNLRKQSLKLLPNSLRRTPSPRLPSLLQAAPEPPGQAQLAPLDGGTVNFFCNVAFLIRT